MSDRTYNLLDAKAPTLSDEPQLHSMPPGIDISLEPVSINSQKSAQSSQCEVTLISIQKSLWRDSVIEQEHFIHSVLAEPNTYH